MKKSKLALGCMRMSALTNAEAERVILDAFEHEITLFDHADIYGGGKSEELFGSALNTHPWLREKIILQDKCGICKGYYDLSREHILEAVDGSLKRLGTDHLDILLLHRPDALMEPEEVGEAFDELKKAGKVRSFGVSNENRFQMELLRSGLSEDLAANQIQMSIVHCPTIDAGINVNMMNDPGVMRDGGTIEYCRMKKMAVQCWSPLQKGFFGGVFLGSEEYPKLNELLQAIAEEKKTSVDAVAYAWLLRIPAKMQVITGTTKPSRILEAAKATEITPL